MAISALGRAARELAAIAHHGQMYGERPYLYHVMRVARHVRRLSSDPVSEAAAYLHDVLEDTTVTETQILAVCGSEVLGVVQVLTRGLSEYYVESYSDYIKRVSQDERASLIKAIDLSDHLAQKRPKGTLAGRYRRALEALQNG